MNAPLRRGACPGLSAPMVTGDGLLARLTPASGTISLAAFAGLCTAARCHGNGIVEVTSRGSIQFRGLTHLSAPAFATAVASLGVEASHSIPVLVSPLSGFDPAEIVDASGILAELGQRLASASFTSSLSAKTSIVLDGGGSIALDPVPADVRLRATGSRAVPRFDLALGGDASTAVAMGAVPAERAVECVMRLLQTLAKSPGKRMRHLIEREGVEALKSTLTDLLIDGLPVAPHRLPSNPIGRHALVSGAIAVGVGLPFGHSETTALLRLVEAARIAGSTGLRTSHGRALIFIGLSAAAARQFADDAAALGFVVDPGDPRLRVIACAGAPICSSGQIPARAMASAVAEVAPEALPNGGLIHVSGCVKACAHRGPSSVMVIGRAGLCDVIVGGMMVGSVDASDLTRRLPAMISQGGIR